MHYECRGATVCKVHVCNIALTSPVTPPSRCTGPAPTKSSGGMGNAAFSQPCKPSKRSECDRNQQLSNNFSNLTNCGGSEAFDPGDHSANALKCALLSCRSSIQRKCCSHDQSTTGEWSSSRWKRGGQTYFSRKHPVGRHGIHEQGQECRHEHVA